MTRFVDLTHDFRDAMPGYRMTKADGSTIAYTSHIRPGLTFEESIHLYGGAAAFQVTELSFHGSVGTYIDSPFVRFPDGRDVAELKLEELIRPGLVIELPGCAQRQAVGLPEMNLPEDIAGKAVLFRFGWDRYFWDETYEACPFVARDVIAQLVTRGAGLFGVDTPNADNPADLERPAHTQLLSAGIPIIENLRGLDALPSSGFRFYALPIKACRVASMPVRAFAEVTEVLS